MRGQPAAGHAVFTLVLTGVGPVDKLHPTTGGIAFALPSARPSKAPTPSLNAD